MAKRARRRRKPMSAATKAKISKALKGKHHPHKGHRNSSSTRSKISKALKGKKHPHKGHAESAATRAKISKALKGKHHKRRTSKRHLHRKTVHRLHAARRGGRSRVHAPRHHNRTRGPRMARRSPKLRWVRRHKSGYGKTRRVFHHHRSGYGKTRHVLHRHKSGFGRTKRLGIASQTLKRF